MVIQFSDEKARGFLLEHGHVFTARLKKRVQVGKDWACVKRGEKKFADVFITYMGFCREGERVTHLKNYAEYSGFKTVVDWMTAIRNLNKGKNFSIIYIYAVKIKKLFEEVLKE